jgi:folylpolyglutamate synthase
MFPSMATYFRFLTLVCFKVFIEEQVDVAIIEVGLGGRYDATNVIDPAVVGITSIGYDHVEILGDTLDKIAWQKAGIMKPNVPAVIAPQKQEAHDMFVKVANEVQTPMYFSPSLDEFAKFSKLDRIPLGLSGEHQQVNAALALCLCDEWVNKRQHTLSSTARTYPLFVPSESQLQGLAACTYEGRAQVVTIDTPAIVFYLDGAHTDESIGFCGNWFQDCMQGKIPSIPTREDQVVETSANENDEELQDMLTFDNVQEKSGHVRVLIFNFTGMREPAQLLHPLAQKKDLFDYVIFCPNDSDKDSLKLKKKTLDEQQLQKLNAIKTCWDEMTDGNSLILPSINDCLKLLWEISEKTEKVSVLVTGSFYLVGDTLRKLHKIKNKNWKQNSNKI